MTKRLYVPLIASAFLALPACSEAAEQPAAEPMEEAAPAEVGTIVDVASGNPDFSTLVAAVTAAGLVETLSGEGPFTVFAPANAAFDALPEGTVETLTTTETETLSGILTYHVVPGNIMAADLLGAIEGAGEDGYVVTTVNGATFTARAVDGAVQLTDAAGNVATVTATDVPAANGVIHVIDTVLMPS